MAKKELNEDVIQAAVNFDWQDPANQDPAARADFEKAMRDLDALEAEREEYMKATGFEVASSEYVRALNEWPKRRALHTAREQVVVFRASALLPFVVQYGRTDTHDYSAELEEAYRQIAERIVLDAYTTMMLSLHGLGLQTDPDYYKALPSNLSAEMLPFLRPSGHPVAKTKAEYEFALFFGDDALDEMIRSDAFHVALALGGHDDGIDAIRADAIRRKWEIVESAKPADAKTDVGVNVRALPRPTYPAQKFLAVDQCTRAIIDPWSEDHAKLYKYKELIVHPSKGVDTTLTIQAAVDAVLDDLSPGARNMLEVCMNLWDDALVNGLESVYPIDHVVRNNKCGGSAFGIKGIKVTAEEREQAWSCLRELKRTELRIDWQKEAGKRDIDDYAPIEGALVSWDREPRKIGGVIKDCLVINSIPLHRYASAVGRIDRRDAQLSIVDDGKRWKRTPRNTALQNYLYRQIVETDRQAGVTSKDIRIDTIWDHCQDVNNTLEDLKEWANLTRTTKMRFRNEVKKVLSDFQANGLIKSASFLKNTRGEINRVRVYLSKRHTA